MDSCSEKERYGGEGTAIFVANAIEIYCDDAELNCNFQELLHTLTH